MSPEAEDDTGDKAAKQAAADPVAVQAAIDKAVADARKSEADARSAEAKAITDEREATEKGSALAIQQRDAATRKATVEAEKATAAAQRDQVAALIPDFSKVQRGSLEVKGDQPLFGTALAQRALDAAAETMAAQTTGVMPREGKWRLLITSDSELASSHAAYIDVVTGLDQLSDAADKLLGEEPPKRPAPGSTQEFAWVAPVLGGIASAVPGLLSLFAAHRTITTATVTVDDLAAAAASAGALKRVEKRGVVVHDDFRLLFRGVVHDNLAALSAKRQELVGHKIAWEADKARSNTELSEARDRVKDLEKQLEDAKAADKPDLQTKLEEARRRVGPLDEVVSAANVMIGLVDSVLSAIDTFVASLTAVPEGATCSPLALAAMREHLHDLPTDKPTAKPSGGTDEHKFTHVLLVKGNGGSAQQAVNDKFWGDDKFAVVAMASITYMLLDTQNNHILAAGNAAGSVEGSGTIGDGFEAHLKAYPLD